ncbi:hypothetical protein Ab1vBOLIVR5_gp95c [Agrobacterium phage OLIVR5]|uniref:Uncharacterized protein n=1 Tax=Agrobacterium phage OLIVR5 TaxID=2723773 RepID=A0A858MT90_9CAUD|nr:hypothetical protein KNU99_gp095 [Agrobacterium phage OLIVR5]QIW87743.1 hypothetical protein Ab1vBOLIVR5_gp95c [Agrobacterium phage OLIVR5]QIW88005.1 hypothetical protein Ab1vBOLIVR6_gp98c [Agrobacterium phage OLIVR6]
MRVSDLLEILEGVNPHLPLHMKEGVGIKSVKVIDTLNYSGVESFVEFLTFYDKEHTPDLEDTLIERETGFKNREDLIKAYLEQKHRIEGLEK